jgi:hypothetical protein
MLLLDDDFEEKVEAKLAEISAMDAARAHEALAEALATSKGWIGLYSMPKEKRADFYVQASEVLRHLAMQGFGVVAQAVDPSALTPWSGK